MDNDVASLAATLAGRYRIERELGRGGMSAVYLARDLRHDRSVALKLLRAELSEQIGPERFQREIRLAARLQHPHILTVLDSGVTSSRRVVPRRAASTKPAIYWFTMPYVEGESLRERLDREKQLPVDDALRIVREVALGLEYAHRHGVVHRDIKPENILLSEDGSTLLADFGIACSLEPDAREQRLTETGVALGTPIYMSPEQAAGERDVDARTDIYSLGVVLYEILAGKPPFTGPTPQSIIAQRFSEDVPRLRRARGSVPEGVERMVARAMAVVPADRWSDAASFARAVSQAELALASTETRMSTRWLRPVHAALLLTLLGAGALGAYVLRENHHGDTPAASAASVRRLAVLPFDNLGDSSDAYFAEGVTDAVRGELTTIPGLEVVASGSSREYRGTRKSPRQIGRELNVDYLLVGSVRWEKLPGGMSRVRVTPELVEVSSTSARWHQSFDAALTDVFEVQSEIAARVAQRLNVALGEGAQQRLAQHPTENVAAYDAYLRGEAISRGLSAVDAATLNRAAVYYAQAAALDSGFMEAWARLAEARSGAYYAGVPTTEGVNEARSAARRALSIAPDRPEGHLALGMYYSRVERDFAKAAAELAAGLRFSPNDADLLTLKGVNDEFRGQWDSALTHLERAAALDPRSPGRARLLGYLLLRLHRYDDATVALERGIAIDSTDADLLEDRAMVELARGDMAGARSILQSVPRSIDAANLVAHIATYWDLYWVLDDVQQRLLLRLGPSPFGGDHGDWALALAQTHWLRGDTDLARSFADTASVAFERQLASAPDDALVHALHGLSLAYLGRQGEAIEEGKRAVSLTPVSSDAYTGPYLAHVLVRIYLLGGAYDKALNTLEPLLQTPYHLSPGWLRVDPTFTALHGNLRFERLAGDDH